MSGAGAVAQADPAPCSAVELFDRAGIADPYPLYRSLRELGSMVWLSRHDVFAVTRYAEVREVLRDWRTFTTSRGVAMDPAVNAATSGPGQANSLTSDPPLHDEIRKVTSAPLLPGALKEIKPLIDETARRLVDDLCARRSFDGMRDLAQVLPLAVVSELVGLPAYGRESMLRWAAATFNAMGPMNELGAGALADIRELHVFCREEAVPGRLKPDGWADRLYQAAARGEVPLAQCPGMMREYIGPSLDTTIFATGHLIRLLGENPDQWRLLREDPSLIPGAINEALRMESPIRSFSRYVNRDASFGDVVVPAGARLLVLYASANRDERKWERPDEFLVTRKATDHLAFGHGVHMCAGLHLARLEMMALMTALVERVERIEVGVPEIAYNNTLRGYASLPVTLH